MEHTPRRPQEADIGVHGGVDGKGMAFRLPCAECEEEEMRKRNRWLRLALILASILALSSNVGASAADEWRHVATPGTMRILLADPTPSDAFVAAPAQAPQLRAQAAQIVVDYEGFSPEARAAFQYAVDIWQGLLNAPIPIRVKATWTSLDEGVLGGAGAAGYLVNTGTNTIYPVALGQQLANTDPNPGEYDIEAVFNSEGVAWYYGTGQTPSGQYNLATVVLHELGHGLGFSDSFGVSGGVGGYGDSGRPVIFDRFVFNVEGVALTDTARFPNPSAALAGQLQSGALFFNGASARAANGGTPPRLYAPNPFENGSSIAHFDEATYRAGHPNALMTPFLRAGETIYNPGAIAVGALADLGWSVVGVFAPCAGFEDVATGDPACAAIAALVADGVIAGYATTPPRFGPADPVQRAQLAAFLVRGLAWQGEATGPRTFTDFGTLVAELRTASLILANTCDSTGLCTARGYEAAACAARGVAFPCFGPNDGVSYAQVISFVARAFQFDADYGWVPQPNGALPYQGVPSVHQTDVKTYHANAGIIPAPPQTEADWNMVAPRAWVARVLFQALGLPPVAVP